jgi:hypothetical protein
MASIDPAVPSDDGTQASDAPAGRTSTAPGTAPQMPQASELPVVPIGTANTDPTAVPGNAAPIETAPATAGTLPAAGGDQAALLSTKDTEESPIDPGAPRRTVTREMRPRGAFREQGSQEPKRAAPAFETQHERAAAGTGRVAVEPTGQAPAATPHAAPDGSIPGESEAPLIAATSRPPVSTGTGSSQVQIFSNQVSHAPQDLSGADRLGAPAPIDQLTLHLSRALDEGRMEIRIQLKPEELGQVDIQLEFKELQLTVKVSAERPETLELLQRDARSLSRAFREAGLELAEGDLSFMSGGRGGATGSGPHAQRGIGSAHLPYAEPRSTAYEPARRLYESLLSLRDGRLDVRA